MLDPCPSCGSKDVRVSRQLTVLESVGTIFGHYPVRCRRCNTRFTSGIWKISLATYAKCPRCYRTDLSNWDVEKYDVPARIRLKLSLGANPLRCEYCRCNFASFRPRYERFSWRKLREQALKPLPPGSAAAAAAAAANTTAEEQAKQEVQSY